MLIFNHSSSSYYYVYQKDANFCLLVAPVVLYIYIGESRHNTLTDKCYGICAIQMQGALDKANKASEEKDATITSLHQRLEEMEERLVGGDDVQKT